MPLVEHGGVRGNAPWGLRLGTAALAAVAGVAMLAAALEPRRSRGNAVWEWDDVATARVALLIGLISVVGALAVAASPWRSRVMSSGRVLAAQAVVAGLAVACALVVLRSGAWLMDVRAVPVP